MWFHYITFIDDLNVNYYVLLNPFPNVYIFFMKANRVIFYLDIKEILMYKEDPVFYSLFS